jgi:hypothetical protein
MVCVSTFTIRGGGGGVFIGPWGSSTDLAEAITHQVVVGWPIHMAGQ